MTLIEDYEYFIEWAYSKGVQHGKALAKESEGYDLLRKSEMREEDLRSQLQAYKEAADGTNND